jgi:hypothetical protein
MPQLVCNYYFFIFQRKTFLFGLHPRRAIHAPLIANVTKINYNPMGILGSIINII